MSETMSIISQYLSHTPLSGLVLTLVTYQLGHWVWRRAGMIPVLNPVMIAIILIGLTLWLTGWSYQSYFQSAQLINFLLGPATVALAIPLYRQMRLLLSSLGALAAGLIGGSAFAIISAVGFARLLGASEATLRSLAPKSTTSPIAMGISDQIGGIPALTAVLVILTGIVGSMMGPWILRLFRVRDERAQGVAIGTAAHGIGTARALQMGDICGAFSGLAMGLNGVATAILVPLLIHWLMGS